jgi:LL-diaminopimelate aminotransferase
MKNAGISGEGERRVRVNEDLLRLSGTYLFVELDERIAAFRAAHPNARLIDLGQGDVSRGLPAAIMHELRAAVEDMSHPATFRGYGPAVGYTFLRELIAVHDYCARGIPIDADEIFVSDGAKGDTAQFQELFDRDATVAVIDPAYPVYVESNIMSGRVGELGANGRYDKLEYLVCTPENGFRPMLPDRRVDLIYLCSPNNPTGAVMSRAALAEWVEYARAYHSVILFDAAYEAYVRDAAAPRSIYEVSGAREVAVEFRSFSKTAGFTGMRCGFTVIPREIVCGSKKGTTTVSVNALWRRRQSVKFGGTPYVVQRAAAATYSKEGQEQVRALVDSYLENCRLMRAALEDAGFAVYGGRDAPYVWLKVPPGLDSWGFFDRALEYAHLVVTPGVGFGPGGEGYVRISGFRSREDTQEAADRIRRHLIV